MLTRDLKKSNAHEVVHGKLIIHISTNSNATTAQIGIPGNNLQPPNHIRNPSTSSSAAPASNRLNNAQPNVNNNLHHQMGPSLTPPTNTDSSRILSSSAPRPTAPVTVNGGNSGSSGGTSAAASSANPGRTFGAFEDHFGPLPPG